MMNREIYCVVVAIVIMTIVPNCYPKPVHHNEAHLSAKKKGKNQSKLNVTLLLGVNFQAPSRKSETFSTAKPNKRTTRLPIIRSTTITTTTTKDPFAPDEDLQKTEEEEKLWTTTTTTRSTGPTLSFDDQWEKDHQISDRMRKEAFWLEGDLYKCDLARMPFTAREMEHYDGFKCNGEEIWEKGYGGYRNRNR